MRSLCYQVADVTDAPELLQRVPGLVGTDAVRRHGRTHNSRELEDPARRWRSFWSAPKLSCWGPRATPGRTGKLEMLAPDGELLEEQLQLLDEDAAAERLSHLQSVEHVCPVVRALEW